MIKELGLFPLNLVPFPGERLNLHIFEPRYKQLINDCLQLSVNFGIPAYITNKIEYGTEMRVLEVQRVYEDGRMDIRTEGVHSFKVTDFCNPWKDRLYAGGKVEMLPFDDREEPDIKLQLSDLLNELFGWLQIEDQLEFDTSTELAEVIHKIGLKPDEEYYLLQMTSEKDRQLYVIDHLKKILPALERAEKAKERIRMNGHFKHLDPLNF
jgi:hypothetical protein